MLNGTLGRAPNSSPTDDEAIFFCVGHDDPRDGADGFFLPAGSFRHAILLDVELGSRPDSELLITFEAAMSLIIENLS